MSFEQSSFRNNNHITRPQVDVVLKIRARKEIVVVEDVKRLDAIDFPAQLDALFGSKWAEPAGDGDRLHEVEPLLHHERTGSENFTGNEYFGFEIGVFAFDDDQSDGDIRFFSESAFEARFKHTFEFGWGQTASTDLSGQRKRDHPSRADEDLAIELRILINRDADHIARLQPVGPPVLGFGLAPNRPAKAPKRTESARSP